MSVYHSESQSEKDCDTKTNGDYTIEIDGNIMKILK